MQTPSPGRTITDPPPGAISTRQRSKSALETATFLPTGRDLRVSLEMDATSDGTPLRVDPQALYRFGEAWMAGVEQPVG